MGSLISYPVFSESKLDLTIFPFATYEHASDRIKLSNVTTRYGIGAAGLGVSTELIPSIISASIRYGAGYHPSYTLNSFGTEFTGPVRGELLEYGLALDTSKFIFPGSSIEHIVSNRSVFSDSLVGKRGARNFTTTSEAEMKSSEIRINQSIYQSEKHNISIFLGTNDWTLNAIGTAYSEDLTVKKKVSGKNQDVVWGFNYTAQIYGKTADFGFIHRTISADNIVETYELTTKIRF